MVKVFISQVMKGLSDEQIKLNRENVRTNVKQELESRGIKEIEFIDTMIHDEPPEEVNIPVWYLGNSIKQLATADYAYFDDGWVAARGCKIEHSIAKAYNIPILRLTI